MIKWAVSFRLHSLGFVILPYLLGILVAVFTDGYSLDLTMSAVGLIPLLLIHCAANLISDIKDYQKGIDTHPDLFSGGIVRGWISVREAGMAVVILYTLSIMSGLFLVLELGTGLIPILISGMFLGIFYSVGNNFAFKYNVTGEWFIFLGFGILIPAYGYFLNGGHLSGSHVYISLPAAFLLAAVKHANNWIAALSPVNVEKYTTASLIGYTASVVYYLFLTIVPYILTAFLIWQKDKLSAGIPDSLYLTYLSFPLLFMLIHRSSRMHRGNSCPRILSLDSTTALLYLLFISLSCASVVIGIH